MIYVFFSAVFITLFLVIGFFAVYHLLLQMQSGFTALSWRSYKKVIVLAIVAALCFTLACFFGTLIPDCYATTNF